MSEQVTATMEDGVLTLEFTSYMLQLPVEGNPNDGMCLVHLQAPTGPSDTVPLDRIAIATAAVDGIFAVPVPDPQAQTYAYYPLDLPFVAMTMNRELEPQIRLLWTGPDENLALLHAQVVEEGERIRFTAVRPSLAQVLASMPNLQPGTRIFVAVSAEFEHHEMRFVSEMPDDPDGRYMEITRCRKDASVRDLQVGIGIKVKAEHEDEARRALESAGFSTRKE